MLLWQLALVRCESVLHRDDKLGCAIGSLVVIETQVADNLHVSTTYLNICVILSKYVELKVAEDTRQFARPRAHCMRRPCLAPSQHQQVMA